MFGLSLFISSRYSKMIYGSYNIQMSLYFRFQIIVKVIFSIIILGAFFYSLLFICFLFFIAKPPLLVWALHRYSPQCVWVVQLSSGWSDNYSSGILSNHSIIHLFHFRSSRLVEGCVYVHLLGRMIYDLGCPAGHLPSDSISEELKQAFYEKGMETVMLVPYLL